MNKKIRKSIIIFYIVFSIIAGSWVALSIRQRLIYKKGVYDCSDMTLDCKKIFDAIGIKNTIINGYNNYGTHMDTHCWLELELPFWNCEFECTTLTPTKVSDKYRNCWITVNKTVVMWN